MTYARAAGLITWKLHLGSTPASVFELLSSDAGRAQWWAESAIEQDGQINFTFPNGFTWTGEILCSEPPDRFGVRYFDGDVFFKLTDDGRGGTDLKLTDQGAAGEDRYETHAGWVSVLMTLKAVADYDIDLRNHDPSRSWAQGYADN